MLPSITSEARPGVNWPGGGAARRGPGSFRLVSNRGLVGAVAALRSFRPPRQLPGMSDSPNIKPEARRLVESLPDSATWDDLAYEVYVRQSVEAGLADA